MTITDVTKADKCQKRVSNGSRTWTSHVCGRKVKEEGLCGLHLSAKRRAEARDAEYRAKCNESTRNEASVQEFLKAQGIKAIPEYSALTYKYTGRVVIALDELRRVLGLDPS